VYLLLPVRGKDEDDAPHPLCAGGDADVKATQNIERREIEEDCAGEDG
jgi:hypothetical protein